MSSVPAKKMLETLLKSILTAKDREAFESMWDAVHRYGGLSKRQTSWIEEVYYKVTKEAVRPPPKKSPKLGFITDAKATKVIRMTSIKSLQLLCPHIKVDSPQYKAIADFFKSGGEVFEVRPKEVKNA